MLFTPDLDVWTVLPIGLSVLWLALLYLVVWTLPNTQQIMGRFRPALGFTEEPASGALQYRLTFGWAVATGMLAAVAVLLRQQAEFVYFQF